jgi:hypothetical protein
LLGKDWEWGKSGGLKRVHFSLKLDLLRRGGIDFLWVPPRLIIFQISVWLNDERCLSQLELRAFFAALDQAVSNLWQRSNSSEIFLRRRDFACVKFFFRIVRFGVHHAAQRPFGVIIGAA